MSMGMFNWILFVVTYIVYHLTLLPSVPGGDSGELLANSCLGSTSHPPGYPLFTILSYAASWSTLIPRLFIGSSGYLEIDMNPTFGWKVNHQCCVLSALTAILVALSSKIVLFNTVPNTRDSKNSTIIGTGAVLYAFSPLIWEYSAQSAEVFALNNFLCAGSVYLTCKVFEVCQGKEISKDKLSEILKYVYGGALCAGFAVANQHACSLFLACLVPCVVMRALPAVYRQGRCVELIAGSGLGFFIGLSPYLHLWYNASYNTKRGAWGDLDSVGGFFTHVLRKEYGTFKMGAERDNIEGFSERLSLYISHASRETLNLVFPLALVSIFVPSTWKVFAKKTVESIARKNNSKENSSKSKKLMGGSTKSDGDYTLLFCLFGTYVFYVLVWHGVLSNLPLSSPMPYVVHARFWMQPHIILCILAGTGAGVLWTFVLRLSKKSEFIQYTVVGILMAYLVSNRFSDMDRSNSGWIMHSYAEELLHSLPSKSLLLSHTDLNWNPLRYVTECESYNTKGLNFDRTKKNITHLNFQMMAYPWFARKQQSLYPNVRFPRVDFPGITTNRLEEGNAILVRNMLTANGVESHRPTSVFAKKRRPDKGFAGGIYLDMQAVNEVEIGDVGEWRGLTLLPWGLTFRVLGKLENIHEIEPLHKASLNQLNLLRERFGPLSYKALEHLEQKDYTRYTDGLYIEDEATTRTFPQRNSNPLYRQFPDGSWEFAAISVYHDSQYQLGLSILTYAIGVQKGADLKVLPILLDRLYMAAVLLEECQSSVYKYSAISSSKSDLYKNTAMSWMRLSGILGVSTQFKEQLVQLLADSPEIKDTLFDSSILNIITDATRHKNVMIKAKDVIKKWIRNNRSDKDISAFQVSLDQIEQKLLS